jgi:hypothetical protein
VGSAAVLAGVLAGGGVAGALLGSEAHAVARPLADVSHSNPPPNDPK